MTRLSSLAGLLVVAACLDAPGEPGGHPPAALVDGGAAASGSTHDDGGGAHDDGGGAHDDDGGAHDDDDGPADGGLGEPIASRCTEWRHALACSRRSTILLTGHTGLAPREVHWQTPLGDPPEAGWPVAILFQGSIFTAETFWAIPDTSVVGARNQLLVTKRLLDTGFAVVTPEAHLGGFTAWETNVPPMSSSWELSSDHQLMLDLFEAIADGTFGALDVTRLYAAGISSGGYMTSRMDLEYRERFRALAIHSASFATCSGPLCAIPDDLDAGHLPTLFVHGAADDIVPIETMWLYRDALSALGVETSTLVDESAAHAWLDDAPDAIASWFAAH